MGDINDQCLFIRVGLLMVIADAFTTLWYPATFWDWYVKDIPHSLLKSVSYIQGRPRLVWNTPSAGMLSHLAPNDSFNSSCQIQQQQQNSSCHQFTILLLPRVTTFASYNQEHAKESEFSVAVSVRKLPKVSLKNANFVEFGEFHKLRQIRNPIYCSGTQ